MGTNIVAPSLPEEVALITLILWAKVAEVQRVKSLPKVTQLVEVEGPER